MHAQDELRHPPSRAAQEAPRPRARGALRAVPLGLAAGLALLLSGDGGVRAAVSFGIDPLEVLKLQVKNNVLFIFDTSGSMKWPTDIDNWTVGADDPASRMYQAKRAVEAVVRQNALRMNFGFATYNILLSAKYLNQNQDFDSLRGTDGPFIYVSSDPNAAEFAAPTSFPCRRAAGLTTAAGFFCETTNTYANFDNGADGNEIWRSFRNPRPPYPAGCTGTACRYYLESRFYRSGTEIHWNTANAAFGGALPNSLARYTAAPTAYSCPNPPAGLTGNNPDDNGDGLADQPRPCVRMCNDATGRCADYYYSSAVYQASSGDFCGGAAVITPVPPCTADNSAAVLDAVRNELLVDPATGQLDGLTPNDLILNHTTGTVNTPLAGVRSDQSTPLAASLDYVRTASPAVFPAAPAAVVGKQRNYVILLTDGDDTCAGGTTAENAVSAARAAQALYSFGGGPTSSSRNQAETFLIAFTTAVDVVGANKIARAGSGGTVGSDDDGDGLADVQCSGSVPCRDAFTATNTDQLIAALNSAIDLIAATGTFSAAQGVVGTVFELVVPPASPLDPDTRYSQRVNLLFQSSFDMPFFASEVAAFRNDGSYAQIPTGVNSTGEWDAGQTLYEQVAVLMRGQSRGGRPLNRFTFAELHDGRSAADVGAAGSQALIRRRVFTSAGNGRFTRSSDSQFDSSVSSGRNVVALWPPNQAGLSSGVSEIDPAVGAETAASNSFDDALGIGAASGLSFADLGLELGACLVSADPDPGTGAPVPLPTRCSSSDVLTARKEAREILLAWIAGAQLARGSDRKPLRDSVSRELLYQDRGWILIDQTVGVAAVVTPPLRTTPTYHVREWILFRDGRRGADRQGIDELDKGFGLRNPDFDDAEPATKLALKPRMTIVYVPTNDGVHAIKAETSEELWSFVPFDQLAKIKDLTTRGQVQAPHTYMVASSIRVSDVFVPGTFTLDGSTYDGRWRTFLFFGRGAGGKYYTALDVSAPGPYTRAALEANPPWVAWSRGNPDTDLSGAAVRGADTASYARMGFTWSVPAVGNVDPASVSGPEWRIFLGSGYGATPVEGKTFFTLDALTGDVLAANHVGDGLTTYIADNALVASATAFNSFQLDPPNTYTRSTNDFVSRVFIPDIHGRIWKFAAGSGGVFANLGPTQPIANSVSLLKIGGVAHVYAESGEDSRVGNPPPPPSSFRMFGYKDTAGDSSYAIPGTVLPSPFPLTFPTNFRGTAPPGTGFNASGSGRVFFIGTRFNQAGASCLSSFDSILFAVGAETGGAAYDFDSSGTPEASTIFYGRRLEGPQMVGGVPVFSEGGALGSPPPPATPTSVPTPAPPAPAVVNTKSQSSGSTVCRQ